MPSTVPLRRETSASPPPTVACASPVPTPARSMLLSSRRVSRTRKSSSPGRRRAGRHKWQPNLTILAMGRQMGHPGLDQGLATIRALIGRDEACSADGSGNSHMAVRKGITGPRAATTGVTRTCPASQSYPATLPEQRSCGLFPCLDAAMDMAGALKPRGLRRLHRHG